jgi:hypothetical protein
MYIYVTIYFRILFRVQKYICISRVSPTGNIVPISWTYISKYFDYTVQLLICRSKKNNTQLVLQNTRWVP